MYQVRESTRMEPNCCGVNQYNTDDVQYIYKYYDSVCGYCVVMVLIDECQVQENYMIPSKK